MCSDSSHPASRRGSEGLCKTGGPPGPKGRRCPVGAQVTYLRGTEGPVADDLTGADRAPPGCRGLDLPLAEGLSRGLVTWAWYRASVGARGVLTTPRTTAQALVSRSLQHGTVHHTPLFRKRSRMPSAPSHLCRTPSSHTAAARSR